MMKSAMVPVLSCALLATAPAQDMEVIDLGVPLLSMHAAFEMSSTVDLWAFYRAMITFYAS